MSVAVTLAAEQELRAAAIGFARRENAIRRQFRPRHATKNNSRWGGDIEGACAELAASLALGVPWTGAEGFGAGVGLPPAERQPDVGRRTEVRWAERRPLLNFDARLDLDDWRYVLVTGFAPTYAVLGWIEGRDCRRDEWLHSFPERDVYRVPAGALRAVG